MDISNATVADLLRRYAAALSLEGADRFKLKAYRRAAETIESLDGSVADLAKRGSDLTALPGIGQAINAVILEIIRSGKLARMEQLLARLPPEQVELATKPRLDPKRVSRIYKKLGIASLQELQSQLSSGRIREDFGARMDFHVRRGLDDRPRHLLWSIEDFAEKIEEYLRAIPGVSRVSAAGSLRRKEDTVGDLNFVVAAKSAATLFKQFGRFGAVQSSEARCKVEHVFHLSSGISVVVRWTALKQWGLSLIQATGSVAHLQELESQAQTKRLILTETRTRSGTRKNSDEFRQVPEVLRLPLHQTLQVLSLAKKRVDLTEEKSVYSALGLSYIEPELREGRGEVAAAGQGSLPVLVTLADLRGDLHMHTTASDGANSIEEMAAAAQQRGYEYIAITDHSQSLKITNGLTEKELLQHIRAIDKVNAKLKQFRILKSAEVDILENGKLDYSSAILKQLDFRICSIHSRFALNKEQQTERILRAMDNRYFNILGHATGRLLLSREGYELDIERIIDHAKANGCLFEINSSPNRLDLSDEHAKLAKDAGIKIAVNTDAHSISELNFISAGINHARRAWLTPADVLNTHSLPEMLRLLRR